MAIWWLSNRIKNVMPELEYQFPRKLARLWSEFVLDAKSVSKHIDVVIIPKPSFLQNSFEQNLSNLKEALNKLLDGSVK